MGFQNMVCTEQLIDDMAWPSWMKQPGRHTPLGGRITYDRHARTLFFAHAMDHSTYPDQCYTLCMDGRCARVWHLQPCPGTPHEILQIWVTDELSDVGDVQLTMVLKSAYLVSSESEVCPDIVVAGRKTAAPPPTPRTPRTPRAIMKVVNEMAAMAPEDSLQFSALILARTMKPQELDAWLKYGLATEWRDLSDAGKQIAKAALAIRQSGRV